MKKVKLNFSKISIPLKIQKSRTIVTKLTGNATFTTPTPSLTSITAAINKLETSYETALDGGRTKKAAMRVDEASLDGLLIQLAAYVQDASGGDELKILSSGLETRLTASSVAVLEAPDGIQIIPGLNNGELKLKWNPVKNAKSYLLQIKEVAETESDWTILDVSTRASFKALNLKSLSIVWIRIAAVGSRGKSEWSTPIKATIL